jgi:hypothetical protein
MLLLGVADCCRLIHRFAFTGAATVADIRNLLPQFAGCCVFKTANKRQAPGRFLVSGNCTLPAILRIGDHQVVR